MNRIILDNYGSYYVKLHENKYKLVYKELFITFVKTKQQLLYMYQQFMYREYKN
jgi:hypothetical protein